MEKTNACIEFILINDISGQGDRSTSLGVKALDPQFRVIGGVTTITIFDEQGNTFLRVNLRVNNHNLYHHEMRLYIYRLLIKYSVVVVCWTVQSVCDD